MPNQYTDRVVMAALAQILPGYPTKNTILAQLNGNIVIESSYKIATGAFPALHLEPDRQKHSIVGASVYAGQMTILATYYDRLDAQSNTIDTVRQKIDADLQQMMTNVQQNPSLVVGQQENATSVPTLELSPYKGELDDKLIPGVTVVKRILTLTVNILPYDAF